MARECTGSIRGRTSTERHWPRVCLYTVSIPPGVATESAAILFRSGKSHAPISAPRPHTLTAVSRAFPIIPRMFLLDVVTNRQTLRCHNTKGQNMKIHAHCFQLHQDNPTTRFCDNGGESGSVTSRRSFNNCFAVSCCGKVMKHVIRQWVVTLCES